MGASRRVLSFALILALPLACVACAKGGGGGGGGRRDGSPGDGAAGDGALDAGPDSGRRDTGVRDTGVRDTGPACVDDAIPDDCEMASELGTLEVGGMFSATAKLPTLVDEDWYVVDVPSGFAADAGVPTDGGVPASMQGAGMPRIELVSGDATMVMEIRMRCGAALACGESTARELLEWSFVDDQGTTDGGTAGYTSRDVPWPERVYIKVSRKGGPASCEDYTLNVTR
ncbi:MAG: hypothetical protein GXP55_21640 [Deltaproteobacteria bacterium]|nr:hypothetical protein [Deltaproteobacteria bacterium]